MTQRNHPSQARKLFAAVVGLAVLAMGTSGWLLGPASATHQPADKMAVSGSALEVMHASFGPLDAPAAESLAGLLGPLAAGPDNGETVTLLEGRLKTSAPTDLIFRVSLECALWTNITTVGDDDSSAEATVKVWIELDGKAVPVSSDDTGDDAGRVVFCNRAFRMQTVNWSDENATINAFLRTRSANAFHWITLDVGRGVHEVVLKAELSTEVAGTGDAKAAVGKRTLIVEPVKLANDVSI